MIDNTKSFEERTTLTQRRVMPHTSPRVNKLDKDRLKPVLEEEPGSGSGAKAVIWVVIIVVLAIVAYLGIRSLLGGGGTVTPTTTPIPTPVETLSDRFVSETVDPDSIAEESQPSDAFSVKDQTIGNKTESQYNFDSMYVQKYTSFTRVIFTLSRVESNEELPLSTASLSQTNTITVVVDGIKEDTSQVPLNEEIDVITNGFDFIMRDQSAADGTSKYLIKLNGALPYVLHAASQENIVQVFIDIKEPGIEGTPAETPAPTGEITETPSVTAVEGNVTTTAYSKSNQEILTGNTGKNINIASWNIGYTSGAVKLTINLSGVDSGKFPNLHGSYDNNKLTLTLENRPDGTIPVAPLPYKGSFSGVSKIDVSRSGNITKYEYYLTKQFDYRMTLNKDTKQVIFEVKVS